MPYTTPLLFNFNATNSQPQNYILSAEYNANFQNCEASLEQTRDLGIELKDFVSVLETSDYIRDFNEGSLTTTINEINIAADAVIAFDASTQSEITGWGNKTFDLTTNPDEMSDNYEGHIWITWDGGSTKDYVLQGRNEAVPTNGFLLAEYSVDGSGAITVSYKLSKFWEVQELNILKRLKLSGGFSVLGGLFPKNFLDVKIDYKDAETITVKADSQVRADDNLADIFIPSDLDVSLAVSGAGGLDTGSEAADTWYYVWLIENLNPVGTPTAGKEIDFTYMGGKVRVSAILSASSTSPTLPTGYTKKRFAKFAVRNDASSNILPFNFYKNRVEYETAHTIYTNASLTGTPVTVDASSYIPTISNLGLFTFRVSSNSGESVLEYKPKTTGSPIRIGAGFFGQLSGYGSYASSLNSSQQHSINAVLNTSNTSIYCKGYIL